MLLNNYSGQCLCTRHVCSYIMFYLSSHLHAILDRTCRCKNVQRTSIFNTLPNIYGTKQVPATTIYIPKLKVHCLKHSIVSSFWSITKGHLVSPELLTSEVKPPNAFQDCWVGLAWILLLIPAHNYCMAGPIYQYKIILICISLKLNMVKILRFTVILSHSLLIVGEHLLTRGQ